MYPVPAREAYVHARGTVVEPPSPRRDEPHRERAHGLLGRKADLCWLKPQSPIEPHVVGPVHEDVRDVWILDELLERPQSAELSGNELDGRECPGGPEQAAALVDCRRNASWRHRTGHREDALSHILEEFCVEGLGGAHRTP